MSKLEMLTPQNSAIALIDYQPAMYQGVQSHDRLVLFNNSPDSGQSGKAVQHSNRDLDGSEGFLLRTLHAGGDSNFSRCTTSSTEPR